MRRSLKGQHKAGALLKVATTTEAFRAECPIQLRQGKTYLLFLSESESGLIVQRFGSRYLAASDKRYPKAIREIEHAVTTAPTWAWRKDANQYPQNPLRAKVRHSLYTLRELPATKGKHQTTAELKRELSTGGRNRTCLLYTSPSPRDKRQSRMPSSA